MWSTAADETKVMSLTLGAAAGSCTVVCFENAVLGIVTGLLVLATVLAGLDVPRWLRSRRQAKTPGGF